MNCVTCQLLFHTILSSQQTALVTLVDELKEVLLRALPNLSEAVEEILIKRLISSGLESREDLRYVKQEAVTCCTSADGKNGRRWIKEEWGKPNTYTFVFHFLCPRDLPLQLTLRGQSTYLKLLVWYYLVCLHHWICKQQHFLLKVPSQDNIAYYIGKCNWKYLCKLDLHMVLNLLLTLWSKQDCHQKHL